MTTPDDESLTESSLPEHVQENRRYWDGMAHAWVVRGREAWASAQPYWGCWSVPDSTVALLPEDMSGMDAIELGCGTGYVSGWMVRRGARVVGIDNSAEQLKTAQALADEHGAAIDFRHGTAEAVDLPDASFDFAVSEYGAAIWCDPLVWVPEAHRLLRPGGHLVFLGHTPLAQIATPADGSDMQATLQRSYFDLHKLDWRNAAEDPGGIEFNLPISRWLALFRETGFDLVDYIEIQVPDDAAGTQFNSPAWWGKRWPSEHVWKLRKPATM